MPERVLRIGPVAAHRVRRVRPTAASSWLGSPRSAAHSGHAYRRSVRAEFCAGTETASQPYAPLPWPAPALLDFSNSCWTYRYEANRHISPTHNRNPATCGRAQEWQQAKKSLRCTKAGAARLREPHASQVVPLGAAVA